MSGKKKGGKLTGQSKKNEKKLGFRTDFGDVTLADYANSNVSGKGRLTKAKTSFNVVNEVKKLNIQDQAWDEKADELVSASSFSGDADLVEENEGEEVYVPKKALRRKKTLSESLRDQSSGNTYPIDIWHILSKYIRPEDIAIFSAICKSSYCVVNTPIFWINLYHRYYKKMARLPARLQPENMVRRHGLKASVIRALFYMYPPLAARVDKASVSSPYHLKSRQCISVWQEDSPYGGWLLNFKLRRKDYQPNLRNGGKKPNLLEMLGDIFANSEEGCIILQVKSSERMMPPREVMGLTLHSINISLDMTMPHMNIQLVFGSGRICNGKLDSTGTASLSLKSVSKVSVLDWWHPDYPHSALNIIRNEED